MFTDLKRYRLWYDGKKSYNYDQLCLEFFQNDSVLEHAFITEKTDDFIQFFKNSYTQLPVKDSCDDIDCSINDTVDMSYDMYDLIMQKFSIINEFENDDKILEQKIDRLLYEWDCVNQLKKLPLLYIVVHVINTLNGKKIPWSARGSSAASYLLYVLGVHHIDSFAFDLDPNEFFKMDKS